MEKQSPDFDSIKQINPYGVEFWRARDLAPLLGYKDWRNFEEAIARAKIACEQIGAPIENNFSETRKTIQSGRGKGHTQEIKDYFLSRYACYLTSLNGDPRKPEVAAAQNYFVIAAREFEKKQLEELRAQQEKRLELRERVADGNKKLAEAAKQSGVRNQAFPQFFNAGYKGLYNGLDIDGIKARKRIAPKDDILDRMGRAELAANDFRITQAELRLQQQGRIGESAAINTHFEVGQDVRAAIAKISGVMPEDLPAEPSIKPLIQERRRKTGKQKKLQSSSTDQTKADEKTETNEEQPRQGSLWE